MAMKKSERILIMLMITLLAFQTHHGSKVSAAEETPDHSYIIFQEDFEDGDAKDWSPYIPGDEDPPGSGWTVELDDGNYVFSFREVSRTGPGDFSWTNYTLEVRVKMLTPNGGGQISFRCRPPSRYFVQFWSNEMVITKEYKGTFTEVVHTSVLINPNTWYAFKIVCVRNSIWVYVDDVLKLEYVDEDNPILSGGIELESSGPDSQIYYDDVKVSTTYSLYVEHLIQKAEDEISKSNQIDAETIEAEQRLSDAQTAFSEGDLASTESLALEAFNLAKTAFVGAVSVDMLLKYSAEYDQHIVEVSGTIRDIRYEEGFYSFAIDDGSGMISATFDRTLGEIRSEDEVEVKGVFSALNGTITAESVVRARATVTGRVTDAKTGDPVMIATVTADGGQTTTDTDGSFSLSVKAGTHTLTVSKQGYQTSTPLRVTVGPGETQNVLVTMTESTATITGRVIDAESGDPVRSATVTTDGEQTTTDTDGSFSLSVVVGTHTLTLRKEGYDTSTLPVNVGPGETKDVQATLSESRSTITGTVTDAKTGDPISGATINVNGEQAITDSGGSFSLSIKAGTYTLMVTQKGYKTSTNPVTVDPGDTKQIPIIISSTGLPIVPIAAGVGGIVVTAILVYLKTRKPKEEVPKPSELRITAEPTVIPANGKSTSNIFIELINHEGDPIKASEDIEVMLSTSMGSITSPVTISKDETAVNAILKSSLEIGDVKVSADSKDLKGASVELVFMGIKRYCMHCGAQLSIGDPVCPKCGLMPPSGVDVKQCPNCGEIMPSIAKFCGNCGARQATQ